MQETLLCIHEQAAALTRRSAGLPAMVTGILAASLTSTFFDEVICELVSIARYPVKREGRSDKFRLPQVHALNCLKDVFTHTILGQSSEKHVEQALILSVDCLSHDMYVTILFSGSIASTTNRNKDGPSEIVG